jgi:hypothetical protein
MLSDSGKTPAATATSMELAKQMTRWVEETRMNASNQLPRSRSRGYARRPTAGLAEGHDPAWLLQVTLATALSHPAYPHSSTARI